MSASAKPEREAPFSLYTIATCGTLTHCIRLASYGAISLYGTTSSPEAVHKRDRRSEAPSTGPRAMSASRPYDQVLVDTIAYVYHYPIQNPASLARARMLLLDTFGCAMESLSHPAVRRIIGPPVPGTVVPAGFHLPGTDIVEDPVKGAFDFGTMIRYLDHNDALGGVEWAHPSDNLGAIVAVMDWLSRTSAADARARNTVGPPQTVDTLLVAMIKAYEIQGCFQTANSFNAVGIDHTILVKVAATAVCAWLLGLTEEQALAALSQAWMDGHPLRTFRAAPNTISRKGWAAGDACMRAVHLTLLTRAGQDGAPHPLTGPRWGFYHALFGGKEFEMPMPYGETIIHRAVVKVIACEGHGLTAVEAALQLGAEMRNAGLDPRRDVARIEIRTHRPAMVIIDKAGKLFNAADRDHCMQYIVAVVLLKQKVIEAVDYLDGSPWASDPMVDELRGKCVLTEDKAFTEEYYNLGVRSSATGIRVLSKNGVWLAEKVVRLPLGHPSADGTAEAVLEKLNTNLRERFSDAEVQELGLGLEKGQTPVHEYIDLWTRKKAA
ncbi:hypothetical protein MMC32_006215 [Xylographa parallela]|nr:hypothetical protein [Xylographa parallela]